MYRWFNRATQHLRRPDASRQLTIEKDETLWCTPHGQVAELGSRTVFSFTREKSQALAAAAPKRTGDALLEAVAESLKLPPRRPACPTIASSARSAGGTIPKPQPSTYAVETEPGIQALVYLLGDEAALLAAAPRQSTGGALRLPPVGRRRAARRTAGQASCSRPNRMSAFYTCDVRGIGESQPEHVRCEHISRSLTAATTSMPPTRSCSTPLRRARRTHDVLRVLDWLADQRASRSPPGGQGLGRDPGHVRRAAFRPRGPR